VKGAEGAMEGAEGFGSGVSGSLGSFKVIFTYTCKFNFKSFTLSKFLTKYAVCNLNC
jgi:hypothetical protein